MLYLNEPIIINDKKLAPFKRHLSSNIRTAEYLNKAINKAMLEKFTSNYELKIKLAFLEISYLLKVHP